MDKIYDSFDDNLVKGVILYADMDDEEHRVTFDGHSAPSFCLYEDAKLTKRASFEMVEESFRKGLLNIDLVTQDISMLLKPIGMQKGSAALDGDTVTSVLVGAIVTSSVPLTFCSDFLENE